MLPRTFFSCIISGIENTAKEMVENQDNSVIITIIKNMIKQLSKGIK